jgi:DNA-binding transcriptional LysR family regulator
MTLDQIVAFLRVATEGSFAAASASLHKSQPALSKLVRNLEDDLGIKLFDRQAYRATLTDAGRRFFERAQAVYEDAEALRSFALEIAGEAEPVVRLAVEAVTPLAMITDVLREMQTRFPSVRIALRTERLSGAIDALRTDGADLALATKLGAEAQGLERRRFASVRVLPVVRADHPLAHEGGITPVTLRRYAQIVLTDSAPVESATSLNVLVGGLRWTVTDIAAKKDLIVAGMGWGGLPEHVVAGELASGELVALDVPEFEADTMTLFAIRRRDRVHGIVSQALWNGLVGRGHRAHSEK